ncbi:hypothetical protein EV178_004075 [Coemansia sp. RSA 1646]|nr:hypothetical protein EV178_004075 [Coemansia sp. RSA 1646]
MAATIEIHSQAECTPVENKGARSSGQKTVVFCPADNAIYPRCTIHLYYHNHDNRPDFMGLGILREALYRTLRVCMPLALATDMRQTSALNGGLTAKLSDDPPYPLITKHIDDKHTVAGMMANGFSLASQPPAIVNSVPVANPLAGDALVSVDIVYMTDGVGLSLAISHAVADLPSLVTLGREWGNVAKAMFADSHLQYGPQEFDIDRAGVWERLSAYSPGNSLETTKHLNERWAAEQHSLKAAGANEPKKTSDGSTPLLHRLRISAESVDVLKKLRPAECRDISVGALVSAALWQSHTQAHPDQPYTYHGLSITIRADPQFAELCGNTATIDYMHEHPARISSLSIYEVARMIQHRIRNFTPGDFIHFVESYSDAKFVERLRAFVSSNHQATIVTVNTSRLPYYDIDFGFGRPCKLVCPKDMVPDNFCFMVPHDAQGGIDIYARIPQKTAEGMQKTELLSDHIEAEQYE